MIGEPPVDADPELDVLADDAPEDDDDGEPPPLDTLPPPPELPELLDELGLRDTSAGAERVPLYPPPDDPTDPPEFPPR